MCNNCNNRNCNNSCKPVCNPCSKQVKILYCGQPINCLDISKGDQLDVIIKKLGDKVCQQEANFQLLTYVNIEDATIEQCASGGYVIQVINFTTGEVMEEATICDTTFSLNNSLLGNPSNVNIESGDNISIGALLNPGNGQLTYRFDAVISEAITYQEGLDLMSDGLIISNRMYYISDRGWFLQGLDGERFSIIGHKLEQVVKEELYSPDTGILGVWNQFSGTTPTIGDIVVYGCKAYINNSGSYGSAVDIFELSADWTLSTNANHYETIPLVIHVDYVNDWVFRQEDDKNNTINISYSDFSSFGNDHIWADWRMPNFYNNNTSVVLNNATSGKASSINGNNGFGIIVGNYTSSIKDNYLKTSLGITSNNCTNIRRNVLYSIQENVGLNINDNILDGEFRNNTVENFTNNICKRLFSNNDIPLIRASIFNEIIDSNTSTDPNVVIENVNALAGVHDNVLFNTGFKNSTITNTVSNNNNINITDSEVGAIQQNDTLTITYSKIAQASSNDTVVINNSEVGIVFNNNDVNLNDVRCTSVATNSNIDVDNVIAVIINLNVDCASINTCRANNIAGNNTISSISVNNINGDISNNIRIEAIENNSNNGDISDNESSDPNLNTGIQIIHNTNNGFISNNIMDLGVTIDNNNNNGYIGDNAVNVPRAASVSGVAVNL